MPYLGQEEAPSSAISILGNALQGLAHKKVQQAKSNQNQQLLQSLGIRHEVASGLSHHSDENIFNFLKQFEGYNIGGGDQQQQQALQGQNNQQFQPQQGQNYPQNQPQQEQGITRRQSFGDQALDILKSLKESGQDTSGISPEQIGQLLQNQAEQQALHPNGNQQQQPQQQTGGIKTKAEAEAERQARTNQLKEQLKEQHEENKREREIAEKHREESRTYRKEQNKQRQELREDKMRLSRMKELIKTGKLTNPTFHSLVNAVGEGILGPHVGLKFDINHLESDESQEFQKLSTDFVKGVKNIFGGNVSTKETETFLNTIPNLKQSNVAKSAVINNMETLIEGKLLKINLGESIIKANKGFIPEDLDILVEKAAQPQLEKLGEKFRKGVDKQQVISNENLIQSVGRAIPKLLS